MSPIYQIEKTATRIAAYILLLSAQLLLLGGCGKAPPPGAEAAISQHIEEMAEGIRNRRSGDVHTHLAEDFQLDQGNQSMTRDDARRMMTAIFMRHRNISVNLTNIRVELDSGSSSRASARFNALVTGGSGGILPDTAQLYRVESDWQLIDGEWMLVSASARRALE